CTLEKLTLFISYRRQRLACLEAQTGFPMAIAAGQQLNPSGKAKAPLPNTRIAALCRSETGRSVHIRRVATMKGSRAIKEKPVIERPHHALLINGRITIAVNATE